MIGIDQLGSPIATNLIAACFRVTGYRRNDRDEFVRRGGDALSSPAEVAKSADVVLLCLPSEEAQLDVLSGPAGLLSVPQKCGTYRAVRRIYAGKQRPCLRFAPIALSIAGPAASIDTDLEPWSQTAPPRQDTELQDLRTIRAPRT